MAKIINKNSKNLFLSSISFSFGFILLVCLVSYDMNDNSFFNLDSSNTNYNNLLGMFGSYTSDLLFQSFGIVALLIPFIFLIWSIVIFKKKCSIYWLSIFFLPILLISSCILIDNIKIEKFNFLPATNSGFMGDGLNQLMFHYINPNKQDSIKYASLILTLLSFFIVLNLNIKDWYFLSKKMLYLFYSSILLFLVVLKVRKKINVDSISKKRINQTKKIRINPENYSFPSLSLLEKPDIQNNLDSENRRHAQKNTVMLSNVLNDFNIKGEITSVKQGPIVTLYELTPAPGTKTSAVIGLSDDIARSMSAISTRISPIPGRDAIGIEIPNKNREIVYLRELIDSDIYKTNEYSLPLVLGKDIFGTPVVVDLSKMPHLLVAGTTGSGKSVGINAMILSLLYNLTPEECKLILIDPKMLELSIYHDIPHLLTEVVTDPKKAVIALKWTVKEMEDRYKLMSDIGVREIEAYNLKVKKILEKGEIIQKDVQVGFDPETGKPVIEKRAIELRLFPKIVVIVDELADLMITSGREIEAAIQRLSQMARAAGIHLIVATQRPSVDVITGTIKSNFPSRISYQVTSKIDSRTILGEQGGEQLLGRGDLLITMIGKKLLRVHGPFVQTHEVESVVTHLRNQGEPEYLESVTVEENNENTFDLELDKNDELYNKAVAIVCREKRASTSFIQRHLQIGYNRAARIIEKMESDGVVSPANHVGRREVLVGRDA